MSEVKILDGGFGTMAQAAGLAAGEDPTDWNIDRADDVVAIHRAYAAAGAEIILANTFGANPLKYRGRREVGDLVRAAISNAREALGGAGRVALDIGPTGRLLKPAGDLDFEAAREAFATVVRAAFPTPSSPQELVVNPRPDLVFIETMGDLYELKAAVLAAKENCDLPIYATVALGDDGQLLTGGSVEAVAALLESLGVDAYGFNCGLGPDRMLPYVERLARVTTKPIIVKPNAGLPHLVGGKTVFDVDPDAFAGHVTRLVGAGATIVGGCCGTTPEHIARLTNEKSRRTNAESAREKAAARRPTVVSSGTSVVELTPHAGTVIGERINPTGKKLLKAAYLAGDTAYVLREAVRQVEAGAAILDVNCGLPGVDEAALLASTVASVQSVATCPVQIDTADPAALERALRIVNGKALVNSVNGKRASMEAVFPLVKKYGGTIVALCLDENGIPLTAEGRLVLARRILDAGRAYGFTESDFVFDALTLAVSADPQAAVVTLETVRRLTDDLHVNTVLGVSNVSFGLPNRAALNRAMYALAREAGLSAAIANPEKIRAGEEPPRDALFAAAVDVLLARDRNCERWIALNAEATPAARPAAADASGAGDRTLTAAVRHGLGEDAARAAERMMSDGVAPLAVIEEGIVPALEDVGRGFEKGTVFLPQLLMSADAAGAAFDVVRKRLAASATASASASAPASPVVLATVKGDIHDIGKNIVRALLENYGFAVVDLGRDVPPEEIVSAVRRTGARLVGLSALMTTTVGAMAETIAALKAAHLACRTVVGGAVVTQDYADAIGADFYAKDALATVRIAQRCLQR